MKHVLVISDLHVGSKFGLSVSAGNEIQNTLGGLWLDMVDNLKAGPKLDAIFMGGDMVDGTNHKAAGKGLDSSDMMEQILEAQELIDLIPDAPTFAVGGSTYHVGNNFNADEVLAKMLGAAYGEELFAQIGNVRIHIAHKVGFASSGPQFRATPVAREMMFTELNKDSYGDIDLIIRGHAHYFQQVVTYNKMGIICPCFKGRDEFAQGRSLGMVPEVGYLMLHIDGKNIMVEKHITKLSGGQLYDEYTVE